MCILTLLCSSHDIAPPMAPMLMYMHPDPNYISSSPPPCPGELPHRQQHAMSCPMTTQDMPYSSGCTLAPLTCPAPSQCAAAIPHASHMAFVCPSPSHDLTHASWPPLMRPDMFQCAPPLLDAPHPFSMCHHLPKHILLIPHVPWPLPMRIPASNMSVYPLCTGRRRMGKTMYGQ